MVLNIPCRPTRIVFNASLGLAIFFTFMALFSPVWLEYDKRGLADNCLAASTIGANYSSKADMVRPKAPHASGVLAEWYRYNNGSKKYRFYDVKRDSVPAQYKAVAAMYFLAAFIALLALVLGMALCLGVRNDSVSYPALAIPITMMAFVAFVFAITSLAIYSSYCYETFKQDFYRAGWGLYIAATATFFYLVACIISIILLVNVVHRTAAKGHDDFGHHRHHHRDPRDVRDEYFRHHDPRDRHHDDRHRHHDDRHRHRRRSG